jgi:TolB-like protein/Tfp pilus assembly protein PilF
VKTRNFFSELKRRNVYKVAVAYTVVGWLLVQVATQVFPFFEIPNWAVRLVVLAIVIGFPVALVIAWAFELTPEGLKRTEDVDAMLATNVGVAAAARQPRKHASILVVLIVGAALSVGVFFVGRYITRDTTESQSHKKSIAVLPFENLSEDKSANYFADGIQDQILTKLASIADLKVISRTSTAKYKSKPEDLKTVSQQLSVGNVLEGTVQKAGDKVRINVQLIDARADSHLWAKSYDRPVEDIFAVESEVAQEIADALRAKLSPAEANAVATAPTQDSAAYDLFLKGEYEQRLAESSLRPESFDQAASWYQQAIAHDPSFALAMARLVESRMLRHWYFEKLSDAELTEIRTMAERALGLAPDLAEAHVALGVFYYFAYRQFEKALAEFGRAMQLQPNNSTALRSSAFVHRRQGQWGRALDELKRCLELDPRSAYVMGNLGGTYNWLRMWKDGERAAKSAIEIDPYPGDAMVALLIAPLNGGGDINEALRILATFPPDSKITSSDVAAVENLTGLRAYVFVIARDFEAALKVWENTGKTVADERRRLSARVAIRVLSGDLNGAQSEAEEGRQLLEKRLRERPDEILSMAQLSWVYLALKRNADALKLARQAAELLPPEKDLLSGNTTLTSLAQIESRTGAAADAVGILRRLLAIPAGYEISNARLKIDPVWDPIRNDSGFQQLLTGKEHVGP